METKESQETLRAFLTMTTKQTRPKNIWLDNGTEVAGECKKLSITRRIETYSTVSETKAAYVERTIQSLKNILYRDMQDYGYKYIHKLTQFVTIVNSRINCSLDLIPKNVKNSDFLSIVYIEKLRQIRQPKFKNGDRFCISKHELPFTEGHKPQITQKFFEFVAIFSIKRPTYIIFQGTFLIEHVEQFLEPTFCGSFGKFERKGPRVNDVLSSHEFEIYSVTSLDENCIHLEIQTGRNYYVDLRQITRL